jgi:hypothetical protein
MVAGGLPRRISTCLTATWVDGTLGGRQGFAVRTFWLRRAGDISTRIARIRVSPVLLVGRDEAVELRRFGSANLGGESVDTDLACQQDG